MKLRLNENSVRLRFRRSDVLSLSNHGSVSQTLRFPGGQPLTFRAVAASVPQPQVIFDGGTVEVRVPAEQARAWYTAETVGIYGRHEGVEVLLEKDFRRSSVPSPDDEDRYPNPRREALDSRARL
ncbi:MAG: hypothetical protein JNK87_13140 [Bryobacterales bacterium]|nr:hypothetical protein [Bryobacterales bacterium]